jgi:hypothetical protein
VEDVRRIEERFPLRSDILNISGNSYAFIFNTCIIITGSMSEPSRSKGCQLDGAASAAVRRLQPSQSNFAHMIKIE